MAGAWRKGALRIAAPILLLGILSPALPPAAHAEAPTERLTPSPAPIVALPRLTPGQRLSPPLTPGVVWDHPPEVAAPLSPPGPQPSPARPDPTRPTLKTVEAAAVTAPPLPPPKPLSVPPPETEAKEPPPSQPPPVQPPAVPAQRTVTATAGLYLRATPDAKGRVLDTVEKGERVTAFGAPANGWQRVGRAGKPQGYVTGAYLAEVAAPPKPTATPKPDRYAKADPEDRGCALPDSLPDRAQRPRLPEGTVARLRAAGNLRVAPVCDAKVLDVLEAGGRVTVMEAAGDWYKVGRRGKALGYVGAALLAPVTR
ncbi:hypothetical protein AZL_026500 [Azospirillum sp. B510]|uniref:SH3 domain-containing protein n=1 Tax=Azospirillum sp. (strain B510) TaxID=137722 RepID=UPI0001C4C5B1|nr:SH3 domain-containing protein [Azospirillum sp. B510]BAI73288.1 hypothetical protein AZL_026500 [Azospirillum sp. B510]